VVFSESLRAQLKFSHLHRQEPVNPELHCTEPVEVSQSKINSTGPRACRGVCKVGQMLNTILLIQRISLCGIINEIANLVNPSTSSGTGFLINLNFTSTGSVSPNRKSKNPKLFPGLQYLLQYLFPLNIRKKNPVVGNRDPIFPQIAQSGSHPLRRDHAAAAMDHQFDVS
jgi:hypothetical protein